MRVQQRFWALVVATAIGLAVALAVASCGGAGAADGADASVQTDGPAFGNSSDGCSPRGCQASGFTCGKNADGCGALVDCGACAAPDFCGGGGFSRCGTGDGGAPATVSSCTPKTCADFGLSCGKNADGCGG